MPWIRDVSGDPVYITGDVEKEVHQLRTARVAMGYGGLALSPESEEKARKLEEELPKQLRATDQLDRLAAKTIAKMLTSLENTVHGPKGNESDGWYRVLEVLQSIGRTRE